LGQVEEPATEAGLPASPLNVVKSPYRFVVNPIVDFVLDLKQKHSGRQIAVVMPELVEHHGYQCLLHNQRSKWLKALLLLKAGSRIVLITVPWRRTPEENCSKAAGNAMESQRR